jgi:exopolysaccharide biosynthesis protein
LLLVSPSLLPAQSRSAVPTQWLALSPSSTGVRWMRQQRQTTDGQTQSIFAAEVDLCDGTLGVRVSPQVPGGQTVSAYAQSASALLAINGDYFSLSNRRPQGPSQSRGVRWRTDPWTHHDSLVAVTQDGAVELRDVQGQGVPGMQALLRSVRRDVRDFIGGRERILRANQPVLSPYIEHDGRRHPRTGVGLSADHTKLVFVVIDGRSAQSAGATVEELAAVMQSLAVTDAVKLDGGGSSAMFVAGQGVVNHPSDGQERVVANHIGVVRLAHPQPRAWCTAARAAGR